MASSRVGHFIVFEGIDGAGKTTQAALLAGRLEQQYGLRVRRIREPGGTSLGERLREVVTKDRGTPISPLAELFLFAAARTQLVEEVLLPALAAGEVLVGDRFAASTLAYQGYGRGLDLKLIRFTLQAVTRGLEPDLTILLDLEVQAGLKRKQSQRGRSTQLNLLERGAQLSLLDRFEDEDISFGDRVRQGYLKLALADPNRWRVLDANASVEQLAEAVWAPVAHLLELG